MTELNRPLQPIVQCALLGVWFFLSKKKKREKEKRKNNNNNINKKQQQTKPNQKKKPKAFKVYSNILHPAGVLMENIVSLNSK